MTAVPNLFIVGAPKCGTTALAHYLAERDDVFFSVPKEPFFLCEDFPHLREMTFLPDRAAYLALFAGADPARHRVIAEGSTNYLRSAVAVPRALELSPDARFVVMLRDPVEIAHGFHMEQLFDRNEDVAEFEAAWRLQPERAAGRAVPPRCRAPEFLQYREVAAVGSQLERLFDRVREDRRLVLLQEDLQSDPRALWLRLLDFLDLPDDGRSEFPPVNVSRAHRFGWLADFVLDPPRPLRRPIYGARQWLNRRRPPAVERLKAALRRQRRRDALSDAFRAELREDFAPEVRKLETLLGRDLRHWSAP